MTYRSSAVSLIAAVALAAAPISSASAHGFHHHGDGLLFGLIGGVAAVTIAAATLATAPVRILADAAEPAPGPAPGYYGAPAYYAAPPPAYYAAPAPVAYPAYPYGYGYPRRAVVYGYAAPVYGYR